MASVAVVVFDGVQSLDVSGPLDVFAEANRLLPPEAAYELQTISIDGPAVTCTNSMSLTATAIWTRPDFKADILLVAGGGAGCPRGSSTKRSTPGCEARVPAPGVTDRSATAR